MSDHKLPDYFYDIFEPSLPRLGPGDDASTEKALKLLFATGRDGRDVSEFDDLEILDIGCGNGAQTVQVAKYVNGTITAIDNHQPYLDELLRRAGSEGVADKIQPLLFDMFDLGWGLEKERFDLIWAEGSLFVVGFREGLTDTHGLLKPGGLMAASELTWIRPDVPEECREAFDAVYPAITGIESNLSLIWECGFEVLGHFVLPESSWWTPYYRPFEARMRVLREQFAGDAERTEVLDAMRDEIEVYRTYSAYYGNVFYLMRTR